MLRDAGPEELKPLIDAFGIPTFVIDVAANGALRYAALNALVETTTGLCHAAIAGRCPGDILPAPVAAHVTARYGECVAARSVVQYEEELAVPAGTIHCRTTLSPLLRDGHVVRVIGTAVDISDLRRAEHARLDTEQKLRDFLATASDWLWEMDADLRFSRFTGYSGDSPSVGDMLGRTRWELAGADPDRDPKWRRHRADLLARRPFRDFQISFTDATGRLRHRVVSGTPVFGIGGIFLGYRGTSRDVTEEIEAAKRLRESEQRLAMAMDAAQTGWFEFDLETGGAQYSPQAETMLGYGPGELSGSDEPWQAQVHPDDLPAIERALRAHERGVTAVYRAEYRQRTKDGGWRWMAAAGQVIDWNADGSPRRLLGIRADAHERKKAQLEIEQLALTDTLTGLPNRASFLAELGRAVARLRRSGRPFAVAVLDLDHFKDANDTLGHSAGDELLVQAGRRLRGAVRSSDLIARLGGDEFAIITQDSQVPFEVDRLAQRLIDALDEPICVSGTQLRTSTSIGVTVCTAPPATIEQLLGDADVALYAAKSDGRGTWRLYDAEMEGEVRARRALERDLRRGLEEEQFELWYQPVVGLMTRRPVGVEALIRWNHPERGWVAPDDFIPAAERNRLILPITEWVLRTAFAQTTAWQDAGLGELTVAVNISTRCLRTEGLVEFVARALADTGAEPGRIVVEITESSLADEKRAVPVINALKALGIRVAVDDFGTGYSSMARLKVLPVDQLKIDRSFITDVTSDHKNAAITEAMITLAASLRMAVVAEGVETIAEVDRLIELGCHEAQGFLFARPMPAIEIPDWMAIWRHRDAYAVHDLLRHRRRRVRAGQRGAGMPA